jgi:hypothetical protein
MMMNNDGSSVGRRGILAGTSEDPIRLAVEVIVKGLRTAGLTDGGMIRTEILESAKEALETGGLVMQKADAHGQDMSVVDPAGMFDLVFRAIGLDHHDQRVQETLFGRIERVLTEVLADL